MNINEIINIIKPVELLLNNSGDFIKPEFDSRKINKGDLFVAIKGSITDGHKFIPNVIKKGINIVVCENIPINPDKNISWVKVKSSQDALGVIASYFYDYPSEKLKLVGITGTNGKTTIATTLYNLTISLGYKCGLISTNKIMINSLEKEATHTTPDSLETNRLLAEMLETGCDYCYMEVSSHAVAQGRVHNLYFSGGVFTNLTHDHLDYHKDFKEYLGAKKRFFDYLPSDSFALINSDDKNGKVMIQNCKANKLSYSARSNSNYKVSVIEKHINGMLLRIDETDFWTKFIGSFNAYNLLAVYSTAKVLGFDKTEILIKLSELEMVEGRFQALRSEHNVTAIIDYAHTPDALENVLKTINDIRQGQGNLYTIIGCGGDRDKSKRPIMAGLAVKYSDKVIFTSDNPRTENPDTIIKDMLNGVDAFHKKKAMIITDRKEAIRTACMISEAEDIVLVAGKGHEKYQEINGVKYDFDDKKIVLETFKELN